MVRLLLCCMIGAMAVQQQANPMRKIVTLLQDMQKEIETDGAKEQAAYDKFMCYCDGNSGSMASSAGESKQMVETLSSKVDSLKAEKARMDQELSGHQASRSAAKQDMKKAENLRNKEHEEYVATSTDMSTNIGAMKGAIAALEKGMGSFVQMNSGDVSRVARAVESSSQVDDFQKQGILDLLQNKQTTQSSGEITGMLKAMQDEMEGDLKTTNSDEATAAKGFAELKAAKSSEVAAATSAIESKTKRSGELAVEIVQTADDLADTEAEVAETEKFLGDLGAQCASKKAEWSERQSTRAEEVSAISEAITILNDDDSLDLFKKTALIQQPEAGLRFLQAGTSMSKVRRARHLVMSLAQTSRSNQSALSFIAMALKAKKVDFTKITGMIDGMVDVLNKEQVDDNDQKKFCDDELSKSAQEKKNTEEKLASLAASIDDMSATVATLKEEIATLQSEIKALDSAVAQATEQRKSEHAEFLQMQAENSAATELVEHARNKLYKVYRPEQFKTEARRELTEEERLLVNSGQTDPRDAEEALAANPGGIANTGVMTGFSGFAQIRTASNVVPPPPPETFGAYEKKSGKSNGVLGLMDMFIGDLKKDHTESEHGEETAQKDYENLMSASQENREGMAASITGKESASADWMEKIENSNTEHASTTQALQKLLELIAGLHGSCDFLVENFDARKEARTNEVEGLKNAKAVLGGADMG